jgi:hypothetical protein
MPRTPKWVNQLKGSPPDMSEDELNETKGMGTSDRLLDYAYWLDDPSINDWLMAFDDVDKGRDNGRLLDLLKSEHDLPREARIYLADLLERHQLKKKRGAQSVPAYDRTYTELRLSLAIEDVRRLRESRVSVKDALDRVSKSRGIPPEVLASAHRGSLGSIRRMRKRRP